MAECNVRFTSPETGLSAPLLLYIAMYDPFLEIYGELRQYRWGLVCLLTSDMHPFFVGCIVRGAKNIWCNLFLEGVSTPFIFLKTLKMSMSGGITLFLWFVVI